MANAATNVIVGKPLVSGGILVAPLGTALPTTEVAALNAAFKSVGYVTEDGVTRSESRETDTVKGWGGDTIAVLQTGTEVTVQFGLAEYLNPLTQQLIYGTGNVVATAATISAGAKLVVHGVLGTAAPASAWVIEIVSGKARGRLVFPNGQITETDDITYTDGDIAARPVTLTLLPDASGAYFHEYWDDGVYA